MKQVNRKESGFTLVELLIVVAIIGILAAIAIPQFTKYKKNAAVANAEASMKSCITQLAAAYADDSSVSTWPCSVGNGTIDFDVNATSGSIDDVGSTAVSVDGIDLNCEFSSDQVSCS